MRDQMFGTSRADICQFKNWRSALRELTFVSSRADIVHVTWHLESWDLSDWTLIFGTSIPNLCQFEIWHFILPQLIFATLRTDICQFESWCLALRELTCVSGKPINDTSRANIGALETDIWHIHSWKLAPPELISVSLRADILTLPQLIFVSSRADVGIFANDIWHLENWCMVFQRLTFVILRTNIQHFERQFESWSLHFHNSYEEHRELTFGASKTSILLFVYPSILKFIHCFWPLLLIAKVLQSATAAMPLALGMHANCCKTNQNQRFA